MRESSLLLITVQLLCGFMAVACTTEADTGDVEPPTTSAPTITMSPEELVEWCLEYTSDGMVTVAKPGSETWLRICEERFAALQRFEAAKRIHETLLSDGEIVWCEQQTAEVFTAAKSLDLESIPTDMDFMMNREWFETFWLYDSPEDYVRACSTAFDTRG